MSGRPVPDSGRPPPSPAVPAPSRALPPAEPCGHVADRRRPRPPAPQGASPAAGVLQDSRSTRNAPGDAHGRGPGGGRSGDVPCGPLTPAAPPPRRRPPPPAIDRHRPPSTASPAEHARHGANHRWPHSPTPGVQLALPWPCRTPGGRGTPQQTPPGAGLRRGVPVASPCSLLAPTASTSAQCARCSAVDGPTAPRCSHRTEREAAPARTRPPTTEGPVRGSGRGPRCEALCGLSSGWRSAPRSTRTAGRRS